MQVGRASWVILTFPCAQDVGVRVMGLGVRPQLRKWPLHPVVRPETLVSSLTLLFFSRNNKSCCVHVGNTQNPTVSHHLHCCLPGCSCVFCPWITADCPPCCCPCQSGPPGRCSSPRASPFLSPSEETWSLQGSQELLPSSP